MTEVLSTEVGGEGHSVSLTPVNIRLTPRIHSLDTGTEPYTETGLIMFD